MVIEQLELGLVLPGVQNFYDKNQNQVWKAFVQLENREIIAYVKLLETPRQLYVECLCAIIGRYLGLPIPMPILVLFTPESKIGGINGIRYGFGSEEVNYPSFRRYLGKNKVIPDDLRKKLIEYPKLTELALFDEWIANWDRNVGNILFDGGNNFYFIDHEHAIAKDINKDKPAKNNQIVTEFFKDKSEFEKFKLIKTIEPFISKYKELPYSLLAEKTYATQIISDDTEVVEIINFLQERVQYLTILLKKRLGLKQYDLAL